MGRSRGGFSTKLHARVDTKGRPLEIHITPGQAHEVTMLETLVASAHGTYAIADSAYDSAHARQRIKDRGSHPVIPPNPTRKHPHRYNKRAYRKRYRIEVFFHHIKRCRRVATRYEKTATNYLGLLHLACALVWLN